MKRKRGITGGEKRRGKRKWSRDMGNSRKSVRWSAVPVAPMSVYVAVRWFVE